MLNPYETWEKYSPYEVIIFPKFHNNWAKIVVFLIGHSDFRIAFLTKLRLYLLCGKKRDGQTDKQMDRLLTGKNVTDKQTNRWTNRQTERLLIGKKNVTDKRTNRQTDGQTDGQTDRLLTDIIILMKSNTVNW